MQIREILTLKSDDIHSIAPTETVEAAVGKLVGLGVGSLVVMQGGEMMGLVTERDVVKGMVQHGCNLKDQTEEEQLIGEKYLRRWGVVVDDPILIDD